MLCHIGLTHPFPMSHCVTLCGSLAFLKSEIIGGWHPRHIFLNNLPGSKHVYLTRKIMEAMNWPLSKSEHTLQILQGIWQCIKCHWSNYSIIPAIGSISWHFTESKVTLLKFPLKYQHYCKSYEWKSMFDLTWDTLISWYIPVFFIKPSEYILP